MRAKYRFFLVIYFFLAATSVFGSNLERYDSSSVGDFNSTSSSISSISLPKTGNSKAASLRLKGVKLLRMHKHCQAVNYLENALRLEPSSIGIKLDLVDAYNDYGTALEQKKLCDEAAKQFRKSLELQPNNRYAKQHITELSQRQPIQSNTTSAASFR